MRILAAGALAFVPMLSAPPATPEPETPPQAVSVQVEPGVSKGTGKLTPTAGADKLIAPLGVDPACPATLRIGMRSEAKKAAYATMRVEADPPLTASRAMLTSYLPPGYEVRAKLLVAVPPGTGAGTYGLRLRTPSSTLKVPVEVVPVDGLDNGGNLALRRPVTASSQHVNANYPPCSVADGDRSSNGWAGGNGWNDATARSWPDTVAVALGGARQVSRVDLYTLDTERYPASRYGLRDWDVQVRAGGGAWQTVAQVRGNTAGTARSDFAPVTAEDVRIVALASNGANDYTRIIEVEAR
ncbi:discoidin domain-containing protein [Nonomuraea fuscirosea]|uniref:discoidin domain-containing protein n=1 Tax=Nonomuraea fuscirosea TaxID=1291556 RepID=UPI00342927C0